MKYIVNLFFLLSSTLGFSASDSLPLPTNVAYRINMPSASLSFLSGMSWGVHETISHHYGAFENAIPYANDSYWDPSRSWKNKYRGGNPDSGEKFPGASTVFVSITDAKHLLTSIHRISYFAAGLTVMIGEKRPWWHYALDIGVSFISFSLGFHSMYTVLFSK